MQIVTLMLLACTMGDPSSGTAVGNPGKLDFAGTEVPDDVSLDQVTLDVIAVELALCTGEVLRTELGLELNLLADPTWPVVVDAGEYCSVLAELDGIWITGQTSGGTTFGLALTLDDLVVDQSFQVDGDELFLAVPLPIDAAALEELGENVQINNDDEEGEALAQNISSGVFLAQDSDGDGVIDDEGVTAAYAEDSASAACGCGSSVGDGGLPGLFLWMLLVGAIGASRRNEDHLTPVFLGPRSR
jgi:MYXO-CTERM domain-containing protein